MTDAVLIVVEAGEAKIKERTATVEQRRRQACKIPETGEDEIATDQMDDGLKQQEKRNEDENKAREKQSCEKKKSEREERACQRVSSPGCRQLQLSQKRRGSLRFLGRFDPSSHCLKHCQDRI